MIHYYYRIIESLWASFNQTMTITDAAVISVCIAYLLPEILFLKKINCVSYRGIKIAESNIKNILHTGDHTSRDIGLDLWSSIGCCLCRNHGQRLISMRSFYKTATAILFFKFKFVTNIFQLCTVTVIAERKVQGLLTVEYQQLSGWTFA